MSFAFVSLSGGGLEPFHPIAAFTNFINSPYDSTALNCGNFAFTSGALAPLPR